MFNPWTLPDLKARGFSVGRESFDFTLLELVYRVSHGCQPVTNISIGQDSQEATSFNLSLAGICLVLLVDVGGSGGRMDEFSAVCLGVFPGFFGEFFGRSPLVSPDGL